MWLCGLRRDNADGLGSNGTPTCRVRPFAPFPLAPLQHYKQPTGPQVADKPVSIMGRLRKIAEERSTKGRLRLTDPAERAGRSIDTYLAVDEQGLSQLGRRGACSELPTH